MSVIDFDKIDEARQLLGLDETATLKQVESAYRRLSNRYHPDKCKDTSAINCEEMMKKVNKAYAVIKKYVSDYNYSFRQEDVERAYPDSEYLRKFKERWYDSI